MRAEYDLSKLKGPVQGKYADRCREEMNSIEPTDGMTSSLNPEIPHRSALDVEGIDLGISTHEIVELVRGGRDDGIWEEDVGPNCPAVVDGDSIKPRA